MSKWEETQSLLLTARTWSICTMTRTSQSVEAWPEAYKGLINWHTCVKEVVAGGAGCRSWQLCLPSVVDVLCKISDTCSTCSPRFIWSKLVKRSLRRQAARYGNRPNKHFSAQHEFFPATSWVSECLSNFTPFTLSVCHLPAAGRDERRRRRVRQRARPRAAGQCRRFRDGTAAHPGPWTGTGSALEAHDQAGAGGRRGRPGVAKDALLPGAALLVGMGGHARRSHRHYSDEPPSGCCAAQVVAEVAVLSAAARTVHEGADRGVRRYRRWGQTIFFLDNIFDVGSEVAVHYVTNKII